MGSLQAREMSEMMSMEDAIAWHLYSNHFPPIPKSMVPVCIEAIENYLAGDYEKFVFLPEGISWKGVDAAPTDEIIHQHHLYPWLEEEFDY